MASRHQHWIRVDKKYNLKAEELAPLTDAGLTPYRGLKKLRAAGVVGPDRLIAVFGAGGLGTYAVQYAKLLSSGASVVAFARSDEKLAIAKEHGADYVINTRDKSLADIRSDLATLTGQREIDAVIDCAGAEQTVQTGFGLLATAGVFVSVGLVGNRIDIPLFPLVAREYTYHGSFWGNYADLSEVMALAQAGKIKHSIKRVRFEDINENLELLRDGEMVGRAVIAFGAAADGSEDRAETAIAVDGVNGRQSMRTHSRLAGGLTACLLLISIGGTVMTAAERDVETTNKEIIEAGFRGWHDGTGNVFDLLTPDAKWTIVGNSPVSRTYTSKQEFLDVVITPFQRPCVTQTDPGSPRYLRRR